MMIRGLPGRITRLEHRCLQMIVGVLLDSANK